MNNLEVIKLSKVALANALKTNRFWQKTGNIPFTKSKAEWLLRNERMEDDDICSILIYDTGILISYILMIPDIVKYNETNHKVFFSLRWWVADKFKHSVIPTYTRSLSFQEVNNKVFIKFVGKDVQHFYKKQPFKELFPRKRYLILFKIDSKILVNKVKALYVFKPILKTIDWASLRYTTFINRLKIKKHKSISYEYLNYIDVNSWNFIQKFCNDDLIPKTQQYLNWQLCNNQYVQTQKKTKVNSYCLAFSMSSHIYNLSFLIKKEGNTIGFTSVLIRSKEYIVRYFLCDDSNFKYCANAIMESFLNSGSSMMQTENEKLGAFIKKRYLNIHTNETGLYALAHNDLNIDFQGLSLKEHDAHYV